MRCFTPGVFLAILAAACQQQSAAGPADGQGRDGGADGLVLYMPAGCPPDAGNELGIGKPCSKTGNECANNNLRCTCGDFGIALPVNMPCFCTNATPAAACPANPNCGSNATCCSIAGVIIGCLPDVCLVGNQCPVFQ